MSAPPSGRESTDAPFADRPRPQTRSLLPQNISPNPDYRTMTTREEEVADMIVSLLRISGVGHETSQGILQTVSETLFHEDHTAGALLREVSDPRLQHQHTYGSSLYGRRVIISFNVNEDTPKTPFVGEIKGWDTFLNLYQVRFVTQVISDMSGATHTTPMNSSQIFVHEQLNTSSPGCPPVTLTLTSYHHPTPLILTLSNHTPPTLTRYHHPTPFTAVPIQSHHQQNPNPITRTVNRR